MARAKGERLCQRRFMARLDPQPDCGRDNDRPRERDADQPATNVGDDLRKTSGYADEHDSCRSPFTGAKPNDSLFPTGVNGSKRHFLIPPVGPLSDAWSDPLMSEVRHRRDDKGSAVANRLAVTRRRGALTTAKPRKGHSEPRHPTVPDRSTTSRYGPHRKPHSKHSFCCGPITDSGWSGACRQLAERAVGRRRCALGATESESHVRRAGYPDEKHCKRRGPAVVLHRG